MNNNNAKKGHFSGPESVRERERELHYEFSITGVPGRCPRTDSASSYFGRRRPDFVMVDWANKVRFALEFKRTSDQRDYRERGETRALVQHGIIIRRLEKVAREKRRVMEEVGRSM
jgi:hypothetical protein